MFDRLAKQVEARARHLADQRREEIARDMAAEAPADVTVIAVQDGIALSGPGLGRRLALDPALRRLMELRR